MKRTIVMTVMTAAVCLGASAWAQNGSPSAGQPNTLTSHEATEGWVLL